jgi:3-oxoacyl-[acyl-carrier-protein] synthase-3
VQRKARILGTGSYLPEKVLTNQDLEKIVETSDEWIVTRTGMKERRIARPDEFTSTMGVEAAKIALRTSGKSIEEIDLILVATLTPDYLFPSTAALIQSALKASHAAAFDFQAACTGFLYGLSIAKSYIESGFYRNILLIASEKLSSIVNYKIAIPVSFSEMGQQLRSLDQTFKDLLFKRSVSVLMVMSLSCLCFQQGVVVLQHPFRLFPMISII